MKILMVILVLAFCLLATSDLAFGQICPRFPCVIESGSTGEVASAAIDNFLFLAVESRERIFVIARVGKQEKNSESNLNRLCEARAFVLNRLSNGRYKEYFDLQPVVFAEGSAVEGEGRLEFYLGSKLHLTRFIRSNRAANLDCCGEFTPAELNQKRKECEDWRQGIKR